MVSNFFLRIFGYIEHPSLVDALVVASVVSVCFVVKNLWINFHWSFQRASIRKRGSLAPVDPLPPDYVPWQSMWLRRLRPLTIHVAKRTIATSTLQSLSVNRNISKQNLRNIAETKFETKSCHIAVILRLKAFLIVTWPIKKKKENSILRNH